MITALRNTNFYEMNQTHADPEADTSAVTSYTNYRDGLSAIDAEGCVYASDGPGLGAEVDWDYVYAHRTGGEVYEGRQRMAVGYAASPRVARDAGCATGL